MLGKERLDKILMPVERLLRRDAPWGEVINAGVKASQELQAELELLGKKQLDFNNQNSL